MQHNGLAGHRMMTTVGVSLAWTSSMVSVSTAVSRALASSGVSDMGFLLALSGPFYLFPATFASYVQALAWTVADLAGRDEPGLTSSRLRWP